MIYLYALSAWCAASIILGAALARGIHKSKARQRAGINARFDA